MEDNPKLDELYHLLKLDVVGSTNEEAARLGREGAPAGTLVWAKSQTGGKGRRGRDWVSPGGNLYASLLLRPNILLAQAPEISFVAAVAVFNTLCFILPQTARIHMKWPNDIIVEGHKIAGILLESSAQGEMLDWLVVGIGINIASSPDKTPFPATSLHESGAPHAKTADVLGRFADSFKRVMETWTNEGFAPIRKRWLEFAWCLGEEIEVKTEQETLRGVFCDIDPSGALILDLGGGDKRIITAANVIRGFPT
ncbi:MAG: biotin--[acetyl-CoA-carboxylase] ligase [Rhodospirillaceae bacterium]|nr:biotin--[acetyl-CoA-carboxylase] ligase [Rhodospirillaceae bacterium]MBT5373542.1 biotin--[acetyl-CoA-carboxylase] ligase [Rhodospirillaceae bacterium]MBT5751687.1 biotin--[acetyl-CoA-carboxylase] ligase [Rhodospirillaceae bacterium]